MVKLFLIALTFMLTISSTVADAGIGVPTIAEPDFAGLYRVRDEDLKPGSIVRIERLIPAPDGSVPQNPATQ